MLKIKGIPFIFAIYLFIFNTSNIHPSEKIKNFFPVSVWYGGKVRAPMVEKISEKSLDLWKKDLEQIKNLGFNSIRCWVEWATSEREEGKFDFTSLKKLLDLAHEAGLKVIVQIYADSAPEWVGKKYPGSKFVASNGLVVEPQSAPGFCFDHPDVKNRILRFYSEVAKAVKDKPAFYGFDLWSEPHIINWAEIYHLGNLEYLQFCYCSSSIKRFREWSKKKYGSLENLNIAWHRTFQSWDEVEPPRFGTILTYTDYVDWKNYISEKLAEDLKMKADAVREVIPDCILTSHSAIPGLFTKPRWNGTPDDRLMAESVDYYGVSLYPKHAGALRPWSANFLCSGLDFVRSVNIKKGGFYIGELQAGQGVFGMKLSIPVTGEDIRNWIWTSIAHGAKSINIYAYYPMSSGYEAGGYGLVEFDGKVTERAEIAGKVAKVINENMKLFLQSHPLKAEIAILYNPLSHMVGGQQTYTSEGQPIGYNTLSESLQGIHRAFYESNIPVDFLHSMDLFSERLKQYKLLIVPYPVMMSQSHINKIIEYVENGGTLVAEARIGWIDEKGLSTCIVPGGGLDKIFGCREASLIPLKKTSSIIIKSSHESLPFLNEGEILDSLFLEENFEIINKNAKILAEFEDGKPAIVYSNYGKGKTLIVGSFIGLAYHHFSNPNNKKFFAGLAEWLGIKRYINVISSEDLFLEAKILVGKDFNILFAFNRGDKKTRARFEIMADEKNYGAREIETNIKIPVIQKGGKIILSKEMEPNEIWIVAIEKK